MSTSTRIHPFLRQCSGPCARILGFTRSKDHDISHRCSVCGVVTEWKIFVEGLSKPDPS